VSVVAGTIVTYFWYVLLCKLAGITDKPPPGLKAPFTETGSLTGIVERVFFSVAIATEMSGTAIAMIAWIALKNQILWQSFTKGNGTPEGLVSLLTSVGSMLMAVLGAAVCTGALSW
jgi:hypothetical protein